MTEQIALWQISDRSVIEVFAPERGYVRLPVEAGIVSPPVAGWQGGGVWSYAPDGQMIVGSPRYGLASVVNDVIPPGYEVIGESYFMGDAPDDTCYQKFEVVPIVEPLPVSVADRVSAATGVSIAELKQLLRGGP